MGKVNRHIFSKEISPEPENCTRLQLEHSHDGFHLHIRNVRIRIKDDEIDMWKQAFKFAKPKVENQNLLE